MREFIVLILQLTAYFNMKQIAAGFFTMEDVNHVLTYKSLQGAQDYLWGKVNEFQRDHVNVELTNVHKVSNMILKAKSVNNLAIDVSNFVLAHPSEGLKVLK